VVSGSHLPFPLVIVQMRKVEKNKYINNAAPLELLLHLRFLYHHFHHKQQQQQQQQ
jgi:hypothetical protein